MIRQKQAHSDACGPWELSLWGLWAFPIVLARGVCALARNLPSAGPLSISWVFPGYHISSRERGALKPGWCSPRSCSVLASPAPPPSSPPTHTLGGPTVLEHFLAQGTSLCLKRSWQGPRGPVERQRARILGLAKPEPDPFTASMLAGLQTCLSLSFPTC